MVTLNVNPHDGSVEGINTISYQLNLCQFLFLKEVSVLVLKFDLLHVHLMYVHLMYFIDCMFYLADD